MEVFRCPVCDEAVSPREAAEGWCEACGKKLPSATVQRAVISLGQRPPSGAVEVSSTADNVAWRGWGFLSLLLGALLGYCSIYCPLASAVHKEPILTLSGEAVMVTPVVLVWGLGMTIFGKRAGRFLHSSPRGLTWVGGVFFLAMAGIGLLIRSCLKKVVEGYGYTF